MTLSQVDTNTFINQILEITRSVIKEDEKFATKVAIYLCHGFGGRKLKEIGDQFGVKKSVVSQ